MGWPTPQEYNEAIQNPRSAFEDAELRAGHPVLTPLGLPRPITGAFASVYQMVCANQRTYAVRCFLREFGDQQERYAAISAHLARVRLPYMTNFTYLANGIRVNGRWYPILKMEWIEGEALQTYVERNLDQPPVLLNLAEQWVQMAKLLRSASIGHGDLQHGNVIVTGGQLRLIDYDGMYVPALAGRQSHEIGHRNYQHPQRSERQFDPAVDHFSTWVVYTSLVALSVQPQLWRTHGGGDECLIFRREDFERPGSSSVFRSLEMSPDPRLRSLGANFQLLPLQPPDKVPPIDGTLSAAKSSGAANGLAEAAPHPGALNGTPYSSPPAAAAADWLRDHVSSPSPTQAQPAGASTQAAAGAGMGPGPGTTAATSRNGASAGGAASPSFNGKTNKSGAAAAAGAAGTAAGEAAEEPSWIRDFIGVQQTEPVDFEGDVGRQRLFVYFSLLASVAAWVGVQWISASLLLPAAVSVAAVLGSLAVLANGYRQDASVQAQQAEWRKLGEIDRQIRGAHRKRRRLERKLGRVHAGEAKRREKLEQRLKQSQAAEGTDLQRLDQKLQVELARVQRRRDQVQQAGVDTVNKLQAKHAAFLASLDSQIGGLRQLEEAELAQTLKRRQQQFVAAYMKRQTIEAAIIPGIGPAAKESLRKQGILRAQDLEAPRLAQIEGIGEAKARVLLDWRRKAESLALQASPQSLSKIEETLIRGRFFQRRFALEQEKVKAQRKLSKDVTAAQEQNAGQLKAIDQEPQALRARAAQQRDALRKRHQGQRTQWQSALSALNSAGQGAAMSPEETLIQQELALLTAQRSSAELRLRRYEALAFGSYVRRVVGMG